jgi:hypothetical protein
LLQKKKKTLINNFSQKVRRLIYKKIIYINQFLISFFYLSPELRLALNINGYMMVVIEFDFQTVVSLILKGCDMGYLQLGVSNI